ncbi:MAG TPA: DUF3237 domain-containing protein [Gemmatimonadaceae bacterium]
MQEFLSRRQFAALSLGAPMAHFLCAAEFAQAVTLESELLFDITIDARPAIGGVGTTGRERMIVEVSGGTFSGPLLKGTVIGPSGDWIELRSDGSSLLDVRLVMQTDDNQKIYASWRGISYTQPDGKLFARILPLFETRASKYEWLNRVVSVGVYRPEVGRIAYRVFRIL